MAAQRAPRFYDPQHLSPGTDICLGDSASQHVRVLRLREGDALRLFNGDGLEYSAHLLEVSKRTVRAQVADATPTGSESGLILHLGQAISRGERMDYAVQKATELGCSRITPLFTERCEVRLNSERQDKRLRHWQQVAISACEQSQRNALPELQPPQTLEQWLSDCDAELKLVLHPHSAVPLASLDKPASVALLIGPEGGLSDAEVELAQQQGFQPLTLGPRILRTETAPVAACAILQYLWGDMG